VYGKKGLIKGLGGKRRANITPKGILSKKKRGLRGKKLINANKEEGQTEHC